MDKTGGTRGHVSAASKEIRSLTGLRGIAACWVMLGHYTAGRPTGVMQRILDHKYIAVDLFMILSGFVLARVYGPSGGVGQIRVGLPAFLSHRLARIYPLYLITSLLCYALLASGSLTFGRVTDPTLALIPNLLMIQSWLGKLGSLNAPAWSISAEWAANLLFPLFAAAAFSRGRIVVLASALLAAVILVMGALLKGGLVQSGILAGSLNLIPDGTPWALLRCCAEFHLGMLLWRFSLNPQAVRWLGHDGAAICISFGIAVLSLFDTGDLVLILLFCLLITSLATERNIVATALASPVLHWLGLVSFSIYMVHVPMLALAAPLNRLIAGHRLLHVLTLDPFRLSLLTVAVAGVSYHLFERPCQIRLRSIMDRRSRPTIRIEIPQVALAASAE